MSSVTTGELYVVRPIERAEMDMRILVREVSQVLSDWLYSCLQLDAMIFLHSIPSFVLMLSLCSSHFQHIRSQRQENSHIFVICWSDVQWMKKAFASTPPDLLYNFCTFCNKIMEKDFETKISLYFFLCFHQISLLLSNSWQGWVSFNWASIFLIYFRKIGLWGDFWFVFSFVVFQIFREWANVIGLCSPFLLWVKCPFLSLWKPSGSATSISGRSHWCFMFELFLPAGNLRHYRLIGQNLWECTLCLF